MAASRKWLFKKNLRARAFGWRGSKLAISRLKEAASEIRSAAKSDPVAAGDGSVWLMERIWPAFQDIDTSSGALGTAVARTLSELIPIRQGRIVTTSSQQLPNRHQCDRGSEPRLSLGEISSCANQRRGVPSVGSSAFEGDIEKPLILCCCEPFALVTTALTY